MGGGPPGAPVMGGPPGMANLKKSKRKRSSRAEKESGGPSMRGGPPGSGPPIVENFSSMISKSVSVPSVLMPGSPQKIHFTPPAGPMPGSGRPPMPGGGGPPMPGMGGPPMPDSPMFPQSTLKLESSSSSTFSELACSPFTPSEQKVSPIPGNDLFLSNLKVTAVKSAADQQESKVEMISGSLDWGDMSDEEEEIQAFDGDMRVALEFKWLLNQQSASGMFKFSPLDPRFVDYKVKNISQAVSEKLKDVNNLNIVLATLYALASMMTQFASQKTEWQFMFSKGKRWVSKQLKEKTDFDGLLALLT